MFGVPFSFSRAHYSFLFVLTASDQIEQFWRRREANRMATFVLWGMYIYIYGYICRYTLCRSYVVDAATSTSNRFVWLVALLCPV